MVSEFPPELLSGTTVICELSRKSRLLFGGRQRLVQDLGHGCSIWRWRRLDGYAHCGPMYGIGDIPDRLRRVKWRNEICGLAAGLRQCAHQLVDRRCGNLLRVRNMPRSG